MIRFSATAVALVLLCLSWVITVDWLYCLSAFRLDLFQWPYDQWLNDWSARNYNFNTKLRYLGSALVPTMVLIALAIRWYSRVQPLLRNGLYGRSRWATWREMHRAGIRVKRKPL